MHIEKILDDHYLSDFLEFNTFSILNISSNDDNNRRNSSSSNSCDCDMKILIEQKSIISTTTGTTNSLSDKSIKNIPEDLSPL